jgi:hypothetical protein
MRFIAFILLCITLATAAIPCAGDTCLDEKIECCSNDACNAQQTSENNCDICNPFFSCTCYASGFLINTFSNTFKVEEVITSPIINTTHYSFTFFQLSYSIWQPPKLSA